MSVTCQYGDNRLQCFFSGVFREQVEPAFCQPHTAPRPGIPGRASGVGFSEYADAFEGELVDVFQSDRDVLDWLKQAGIPAGELRARLPERVPSGFRASIAGAHSIAGGKAQGRSARRPCFAE